MVGAVYVVDPVPHFARHCAEQRMGVQHAGVAFVPLNRAGQRFDCLVQVYAGSRNDVRIDGPTARDAFFQRDLQHLAPDEETLDAMVAQIEPFHGTDEAVGQMPAYLSERPVRQCQVGRNQATDVRHDLRKAVEHE